MGIPPGHATGLRGMSGLRGITRPKNMLQNKELERDRTADPIQSAPIAL